MMIFLSRARDAIELTLTNLIDSINEYIIAEYDGSNGISTPHYTICYFDGAALFSLDPK